MRTRKCERTCWRVRNHAPTRARAHTDTHTHTHAKAQAHASHTHTHAHTHTHTNTHSHTVMCAHATEKSSSTQLSILRGCCLRVIVLLCVPITPVPASRHNLQHATSATVRLDPSSCRLRRRCAMMLLRGLSLNQILFYFSVVWLVRVGVPLRCQHGR